jgi:hypothetical protein
MNTSFAADATTLRFCQQLKPVPAPIREMEKQFSDTDYYVRYVRMWRYRWPDDSMFALGDSSRHRIAPM